MNTIHLRFLAFAVLLFNPQLSFGESQQQPKSTKFRACRTKESWLAEITDMTARLKQNPRDAEAYCKRGSAYAHAGNPKKSIEDLTMAARIKPKYADAYFFRGNTYAIWLNDDVSAATDYSKTIALDPARADAYHNRALSYQALGKLDLARKDTAKSRQLMKQLRQTGK